MKFNKFVLLTVLGILLIVEMGSAVETCICGCTIGTLPAILINASGADHDGCCRACAAICGGYTDEDDDCVSCCGTYCAQAGYDTNMLEGCENACESTCELKETINGIRDIIYYIAGIIAAIMFVISGYKLITSDNPEDRSEAKKCIMYIILALIIIIIANSLVDLLMGGITPPSATGASTCP